MAEIDPLIARVLLKGDDEFLNSLNNIAEKGVKNINEIGEAAIKGSGQFDILTRSLFAIEAAIAGVAAATILFVEQQTELSQKTVLLADAFGTTAGQLQQLEATFASSGVKVEAFERFANRLTITIAREWPAIAESIKTYANENDAAQLRVSNSILAVRDAQNRLADNADERTAQMAKDNNALEASYIKLQFAAAHAASEQVGAAQSVRGAELGSIAAQQHLAELEGRPPSSAAKQNLAIAQAQQAVDQARHAEADARIAQQEKAAEASLKQRQLEQANSDLARKAAKDARDDLEQRQKDENAVKSAVIARGEAEQKYAKLQLTNISSIRDALDGIVKGNKNVAGSVDFTEVSVQNLTKAFIAQAAEGQKAGEPPTGYKALVSISEVLSKATDDQISKAQRLAVVNHLAATGMQALGGVGAELLDVLEHDTEELKKFTEQADAINTKEAQQTIKAFRGALAALTLDISLLSQRFALAISPAFTAFLRSIQSSIENSNGTISEFISGLSSLGSAISSVVSFLSGGLATSLARLTGGWVTMGGIAKIALGGIVLAIVGLTGPIGAVVFAIGAITVAIGAVRDNWDTIVGAAKSAFDAMKDNSVTRFWERLLDVVAKLKSLLNGGGWKNPLAGAGGGGGANAGGGGNATEGGNAQSNAAGGLIQGPGSGTSDSILSRLSNGEFVVKAAAVQAYGAGLFHALNNMMLPGFAQGGLVASPVRLGGGAVTPATSTLNLSIDGRSFNGLRGPKTTIDDLSSFAIARQASAAGSSPSWMK